VQVTARLDVWPELPYAAWKETRDTLHLWAQIVGKIRLVKTPWLNHSWHVGLSRVASRPRQFPITSPHCGPVEPTTRMFIGLSADPP
jgi:Family of unknown function (DUF5996)